MLQKLNQNEQGTRKNKQDNVVANIKSVQTRNEKQEERVEKQKAGTGGGLISFCFILFGQHAVLVLRLANNQ